MTLGMSARMKVRMNNRSLAGSALLALPLLLASCGSVTGSQFSSQASVSGARIEVTIKRVYDKTSKELKRIESLFVMTQPQVSFMTQAGSVGGKIVSAQVTVNDESGNRYADTSGQYVQNFGDRIWQGYACKSAAGVVTPEVDPDTCTFVNKVEYTRQQTFPTGTNGGTIQLVTPRIGETATDDCINGPCPANLSMNVTFNIVDDLGRSQTLPVVKAPIPVFRISDTGVEE
ncbi:hypothetical protein [Deinococcus sp. QL22]|uniref:hypothetical protein n=1 Tax=Deinococcus sp. QL22 TaxID=2939437 RepID=UPI002017B93B|nr:hypothetical protein [Deinococcus sp. QL22]UQN06600.1 hypothetical protein M1R55_01370 [Deinococcus sp. QL22]